MESVLGRSTMKTVFQFYEKKYRSALQAIMGFVEGLEEGNRARHVAKWRTFRF
jgi:hypothetical protein